MLPLPEGPVPELIRVFADGPTLATLEVSSTGDDPPSYRLVDCEPAHPRGPRCPCSADALELYGMAGMRESAMCAFCWSQAWRAHYDAAEGVR